MVFQISLHQILALEVLPNCSEVTAPSSFFSLGVSDRIIDQVQAILEWFQILAVQLFSLQSEYFFNYFHFKYI